MTENLRKEAISFAYLQTVASLAGFQCMTARLDDDSADAMILAGSDFDPSSPRLEIQLKASADPGLFRGDEWKWRVKRKNYNDLRRITQIPRLLVVMRLPEGVEAWFDQSDEVLSLRHAAYWLSLRGQPPIEQVSRTVRIPRRHLLTPLALRALMLDSTWRPDE